MNLHLTQLSNQSLSPAIIAKSEERIVHKTIVETKEKMDPNQQGSRQGRLTLSQQLEQPHKIVEILEKGENGDCIYTDFSKVFHKCDRGILNNAQTKALGKTTTELKVAPLTF